MKPGPSPHIKRGRSPSPAPAPGSVYLASSSRPVYPHSLAGAGYLPPLITTQAGTRDLLKEAVSQGLGLAGRDPRDLLAGLGGMAGLDREMFSKSLELSSAAQAQVSKETENYARYLATFQHQLEGGKAELDRARLAAAKVRLGPRS